MVNAEFRLDAQPAGGSLEADQLDLRTVLVIDDSEMDRLSLAAHLEVMAFDVEQAADVAEGIALAREAQPTLILVDLRLPGGSGLDVIAAVKEFAPETPTIVISGRGDLHDAIAALRLGAWDYLTKPIREMAVLEHAVNRVLERARLLTERKDYQTHLEQEVERQTCELKRSLDKLRRTLNGIVKAMALVVEARDPYTAGHQERVARLARAIAEDLGLSSDQVKAVYVAGIVHDLGKIRVPAEILVKPGRLTRSEFNLLKDHPRTAYEILKEIDFHWPIAQIVRQHHEKLDGSGYPDGLRGDQILLEARILVVADVVESMASHRPYRPARGLNLALDEIAEQSGKLYDSRVVASCLRLFREKGFSFDE